MLHPNAFSKFESRRREPTTLDPWLDRHSGPQDETEYRERLKGKRRLGMALTASAILIGAAVYAALGYL